jgi:hypothetical protein
MRTKWLATLACVTAWWLGGGPAVAQTFNSGSTGADGAFSPTANTTLALPASGVFNFTTVTIPAGVTVTFTRNATNTPVTILASGDVTIAGTIGVSGSAGGVGAASGTIFANNGGAGGPGGFAGGSGGNGIVSTVGGAGLGPGGGGTAGAVSHGGGGGFLTAGVPGAIFNGLQGAGGPAYSTAPLLPLIGGSGGGGGSENQGKTAGGGGGGGGALVVASSGTITLTGTLKARGGDGGGVAGTGTGGGGSGGAIRLVATTVTGSGGTIDVGPGIAGSGLFPGGQGKGSFGRIRLEAYSNTAVLNFPSTPPTAISAVTQPTSTTLANGPSLMITAVGGVSAPASPAASYSSPDITLSAGTTNPVAVSLAATNIPLGSTVTVTVRGQLGGIASSVSASLTGTDTSSTGSANVTLPLDQPSVISASTTFTRVAALNGGPVFVEGEIVDRIRVAATFGAGPSQVTYITRSGREIVMTAQP